jgi:copper chaperone
MATEITVFDVEGMSCNHCVNSIKNAVGELKGVKNVEVELKTKKVTVGYSADLVTVQAIKETIEEQGYEVKHM